MKALLDTGVWWRWMTHGPIDVRLKSFLENEVTEFHLCPISLTEVFYKIKNNKEKAPELPDWETLILEGFRLAPVSFAAARLAGEWPWAHGDPMDRILAAVAATENLTLIHTDRVLKELSGFPQRYFKSVQMPKIPGQSSA